jgi:uncharacterized DUF497 family protein
VILPQSTAPAESVGCVSKRDLRIHMVVYIIWRMKFMWDEAKRKANLVKHGLDFADARKVFAGPMVLFEDDRHDYGEQRMIGIGLLKSVVVLIVHVESDEFIRIISMRKADSDETDIYYQNAGYH